jgi:hypothetical protein
LTIERIPLMANVKIPRMFFEDHAQRDLPTPTIVGKVRGGYIIDTNDKAYDELLNDAAYYAHPDGPDQCPEVKAAAKRFLKAIARS